MEVIGQKFGKLVVLEKSEKLSSDGAILYKCRCECGNITYVPIRHVKSGHTKSCGCIRKEKLNQYYNSIRKDLTGQRFGKLTVIRYVKSDKNRASIWLCKCNCGNTKEVLGESLTTGNTISCGCISREKILKESKKNLINGTNIAIVENLIKDNKSKITLSGVKGVGWDKKRNKWRVYIMFQRKSYHLGYFTELEDAIKIRKEAEQKIFGEFLKWYNNQEE